MMKSTLEETKFIVRRVLDYLSNKRAVFEPNGIEFHYRDMSVRKCITVYIKHSIGNSQYIEDFIDEIADTIYSGYGGYE